MLKPAVRNTFRGHPANLETVDLLEEDFKLRVWEQIHPSPGGLVCGFLLKTDVSTKQLLAAKELLTLTKLFGGLEVLADWWHTYCKPFVVPEILFVLQWGREPLARTPLAKLDPGAPAHLHEIFTWLCSEEEKIPEEGKRWIYP
jgi:hypothetical protein